MTCASLIFVALVSLQCNVTDTYPEVQYILDTYQNEIIACLVESEVVVSVPVMSCTESTSQGLMTILPYFISPPLQSMEKGRGSSIDDKIVFLPNN